MTIQNTMEVTTGYNTCSDYDSSSSYIGFFSSQEEDDEYWDEARKDIIEAGSTCGLNW